MVSRLQLLIIPVVGVLLLASLFAFVGFAVAEHRTDVHEQIVTTASNGATMSTPATVHLYVVGPDSAREPVERTLTRTLEDQDITVHAVTDLEPVYDSPVLLVAVDEFRLSYNPISPSAAVSMTFEYAPGGNVTQFGQAEAGGQFDRTVLDNRMLAGDVVPIVLDDETALFRRGDVDVTDASTGILSWPGYRAHVIETVCENTATALLDGR